VEFLSLILMLAADEPVESLEKKMLPIYVKEVSEYTMAVESAPKKVLELTKEPVFDWSNPVRQGLQQGVVYLWLRDGRPAALGCIFSEPEGRLKGRKVVHEFHALDREKLLVSRPNALNEWTPQAGLERKELPDAGVPAATPGARPRAQSHSTTSSARPSTASGNERPSSFAVLRLMISSTFVDWETGSSAGFSPLRIFAV